MCKVCSARALIDKGVCAVPHKKRHSVHLHSPFGSPKLFVDTSTATGDGEIKACQSIYVPSPPSGPPTFNVDRGWVAECKGRAK